MRFYLRLVLLASAIAALAACSSGDSSKEGVGTSSPEDERGYAQSLNHWIGHPEEDLVAAWGVPERSQRLTDGGQALEYRRLGKDGQLLCSTLFTSDLYGLVRTWTYRGNDCRQPRLGDYGTTP